MSLLEYFRKNLHIHAVPMDGHCFFHCLLLATSDLYRNTTNDHQKLKMVQFLRSSLAKYLEETDENGKSVYERLSRGNLASFASEIPEVSLKSLKKLLNSNQPVGEHIYELVSEFLDIDLYVFHQEKLMTFDHELLHKNRPGIIIIYNHGHYELCIRNEPQGWKYTFDSEDKIIEYIKDNCKNCSS
jgi:hypothetical protein